MVYVPRKPYPGRGLQLKTMGIFVPSFLIVFKTLQSLRT